MAERPRRTLMRAVVACLVVAAIVVGAAALAAPVSDLLIDGGWLKGVPGQPHRIFLKVFRRLLLIPLVLVLVLWLKPWRDGSLRTFGLAGASVSVRAALVAFIVTVALGAALYAIRTAEGWQIPETDVGPGEVTVRLMKAGGTGLVVALLEEWFFRAWLWTRLGRPSAPVRSAMLTSAIYAALHAFRPGALGDLDVSHDTAGALEALGHWLGFLVDIPAFGPSFLGLFLAGMLFSGLYQRRGNLWVPIAVHAAAIFLLKGHEAFLDKGADAPWWAGSQVLYDGVPAWVLLTIAGVLAWRTGSTEPGPGSST